MASTEMEEIEIEAPDHSKMIFNSDCETEIGRASYAFGSGDRTISRRHVLLKPPSAAAENPTADAEPPRACFEVAGKNPVWVRRGREGKIEIFGRSERGDLACGDAICLSGKSPAWFLVKRSGDNSVRDSASEEDGNKSAIDLESIDPVKEFGFVVAGREFDQYPKHRIRDVMNWKWFLEEPGEESCESEDGARSGRKRRKSAEKEGSDDEDWTGESEEDREVTVRAKKTGKPAYTTRSREKKRTVSGKPKGGSSVAKMSVEEEGEDEADETLGGFIVEDDDDNGAEVEEEEEEDEEDEEEFDDEEEED